jgi:hypothetical protein
VLKIRDDDALAALQLIGEAVAIIGEAWQFLATPHYGNESISKLNHFDWGYVDTTFRTAGKACGMDCLATPFQHISPRSSNHGIMMSKFNEALDEANNKNSKQNPLMFANGNSGQNAASSSTTGATATTGTSTVDQLALVLNQFLSPAGTASDNSLNNNINNKFAKNLFSLF